MRRARVGRIGLRFENAESQAAGTEQTLVREHTVLLRLDVDQHRSWMAEHRVEHGRACGSNNKIGRRERFDLILDRISCGRRMSKPTAAKRVANSYSLSMMPVFAASDRDDHAESVAR